MARPDDEPRSDPIAPTDPREREASTLDGEGTRSADETAELERLTARPTVDAPDAGEAPAGGDDVPYRGR